jgi:hypothetical protein
VWNVVVWNMLLMCLIEWGNETQSPGTRWFLGMQDVRKWVLRSRFFKEFLREMWCLGILWSQGTCKTVIIPSRLIYSWEDHTARKWLIMSYKRMAWIDYTGIRRIQSLEKLAMWYDYSLTREFQFQVPFFNK